MMRERAFLCVSPEAFFPCSMDLHGNVSGPEHYRSVWTVVGADSARDALQWATRFERDESVLGEPGFRPPWDGWTAEPWSYEIDPDDDYVIVVEEALDA